MALIPYRNNVSLIQKKSDSTLDIFNKTMSELKDLNEKIDSEKLQKQAEIDKLIAENEQLSSMKDKHNKVISKIAKIFED